MSTRPSAISSGRRTRIIPVPPNCALSGPHVTPCTLAKSFDEPQAFGNLHGAGTPAQAMHAGALLRGARPCALSTSRPPDIAGSAYHAAARGFGDFMLSLQSALGVVALIAFAWLISENRRAVSPRRVLVGLAVAFVLAVLFLTVPPVTRIFGSANHV